MLTEWSRPEYKYNIIKENNLSYLMQPKNSMAFTKARVKPNLKSLVSSSAGKFHSAVEMKEISLLQAGPKTVILDKSPSQTKLAKELVKPRVQFRLQSAKVGNINKELSPEFITKGIIIEDKSLSLLHSMYENFHYIKPEYRGISQEIKDSFKLDAASSFVKDNGERPLSPTYLRPQRKKRESSGIVQVNAEEAPTLEPKPSVTIDRRNRPNSMSHLRFTNPTLSTDNLAQTPEKPTDSNRLPRPVSFKKHKILEFDRHKSSVNELVTGRAGPQSSISSKDLLQLKKKKKPMPGHREILESRKSLDMMNTAIKHYASEAVTKLYYIDSMKKLLFEGHPRSRETAERVKAALYKTLGMARTLQGSFPIYEHLKKRKELIMLNPKTKLKNGRDCLCQTSQGKI